MPSVATGRRGFKPRLRGWFCSPGRVLAAMRRSSAVSNRAYGVCSAPVCTVFNAAYGVGFAPVCTVFNAAYGVVLRPSYCI